MRLYKKNNKQLVQFLVPLFRWRPFS